MLFVGVDLGTSAVKLLLMDENGKIKNIVSKEYPLYFPHPGWSEQYSPAPILTAVVSYFAGCMRLAVKRFQIS